MDPQKYADDLLTQAEFEGEPYTPEDEFAPANDRGDTDLNVHSLDMLADPDPTQDPYAKTPVEVPGGVA